MLQEIAVQVLDHRIGTTFAFPQYATDGSAGIDLYACIDATMTINPNESVLINTGLAIHIKDPKVCALLVPRSGLGHKHGIVLGNLVGLIDSDYQGPLMVSCWNRAEKPFTLQPGDKISQLVFLPVLQPTMKIVNSFSETSERGEGGFGSTGISAELSSAKS